MGEGGEGRERTDWRRVWKIRFVFEGSRQMKYELEVLKKPYLFGR